MSLHEAIVRVNVVATNPGQFLACCGLLEVADRIWGGAEGYFDHNVFVVRPTHEVGAGKVAAFVNSVLRCTLTNTMTDSQHARRDALSSMSKKAREAETGLEEEKNELDALYRESPVVLSEPI